MRSRLWPYIFLGVIAGGTAAILSMLDKPDWLVFLAILVIVVLFALIREALRDPTDEMLVASSGPSVPNTLPIGYGRALLNQMPLALVVVSPVGRLVYGNNSAKKLFPRLQKGDHFATLLRKPVFVDAVNAVIADGEKRKVNFSTGQDIKRYFEARISVLPAGNEFGRTSQILIDIEDRTLERQAEKMRSDFIANASHELRTPLASILGYIETLQGHAKDDPEAREEFLEIMQKQAGRMQRLVDDLMSLTRIEMNARNRPARKCKPYNLAREAAATLMPLEQKYGVSLECDLPENGPTVRGDSDQLSQVFVNLVMNAMTYGSEGDKVEVYAAKPDPAYDNMVGVTVRDYGQGIPSDKIDRLTERFYRVNAAKSRNKGGTGLGLAIVKHILQHHGGCLQIESDVGEGSAFTVWLPVANG